MICPQDSIILTGNQTKNHGMRTRPIACHRIFSRRSDWTENVLLNVACIDGNSDCKDVLSSIRASDRKPLAPESM